jgi:hypothetical protein
VVYGSDRWPSKQNKTNKQKINKRKILGQTAKQRKKNKLKK